jgi:hypothetical protein
MFNLISGAFGVLGSGIKGFFGLKERQAETLSKALDVVGDVNKSDDARAVAAAQIISAESRSESFLTRIWRPVVVLGFTGILFAFFFGYSPENVTPNMIDRIFDLIEYSVLGYMGMRSADKWVRELSLGSVLKKFIEKKLG